jgi:predicted DNA-binding transcriptional regulator AlpA
MKFIPHVKVGRLVRFREADVTKWLAERSETGRKSRKVDVTGLGL